MKQSNLWPLPFLMVVLALTPIKGCVQAEAAPPEAASTTLEALVAEALAKNPELAFYEAEITAAKAGLKSAGLLANPELSSGVGQKTVHSGGLGNEGVAWSVAILQPFEWPGRLGLRKAIANRDIELAQLGHERFKIALGGRVRSLAYGLFAAQEKSAAATEVAGRFKDLREVLVQRDSAGLTPLLEMRVIEATELTAQRRASEAKLATQSALMELNQLRGAPPEAMLTVTPPQISFHKAQDAATLMAMARTNNFDLRVRATELAQQGFRVNLAKNERYPALSIGPTVSSERTGGDREHIIGLAVSLPLPLWKNNKSNIEIAQMRQTQAEISFTIAERDIQRRVLEATLSYESKLLEMTKWRPDSAEHFREAAETADRHYRLGSVPISTYVELQKQYLEAIESLLDTKREALEAAAQLQILTGTPAPYSEAALKEEKP